MIIKHCKCFRGWAKEIQEKEARVINIKQETKAIATKPIVSTNSYSIIIIIIIIIIIYNIIIVIINQHNNHNIIVMIMSPGFFPITTRAELCVPGHSVGAKAAYDVMLPCAAKEAVHGAHALAGGGHCRALHKIPNMSTSKRGDDCGRIM